MSCSGNALSLCSSKFEASRTRTREHFKPVYIFFIRFVVGASLKMINSMLGFSQDTFGICSARVTMTALTRLPIALHTLLSKQISKAYVVCMSDVFNKIKFCALTNVRSTLAVHDPVVDKPHCLLNGCSETELCWTCRIRGMLRCLGWKVWHWLTKSECQICMTAIFRAHYGKSEPIMYNVRVGGTFLKIAICQKA